MSVPEYFINPRGKLLSSLITPGSIVSGLGDIAVSDFAVFWWTGLIFKYGIYLNMSLYLNMVI